MPKVIPPYGYPDGTVLSTHDHNTNIWGTEGKGLMQTIDGNLDVNNFSEKFRIQADHVMPEQAAIGRQEWDQFETTVFADGVGVNTGEDTDQSNRFNIPGCSIRFYQPYNASLALLQWSFFISQTKWNIVRLGKIRDLTPAMWFKAQFDGVDLDHTYRELPKSMTLDAGTGDGRSINSEAHTALWFDMSHVVVGGLGQGWHELRIQMLMENAVDDDQTFKRDMTFRFGRSTREAEYYTFQKAAFGIRNARVLTML